jgi:VanZ family protein
MASKHTLVFTGYAVLLTYASLRPAGTGSIEPWDKLAHLIAYAVFALLGRFVVEQKSAYVRLCCSIVLYGGAMEYLQSFMPGRVMSLGDLVANTLGVLAAALLLKNFTGKDQSTEPGDAA